MSLASLQNAKANTALLLLERILLHSTVKPPHARAVPFRASLRGHMRTMGSLMNELAHAYSYDPNRLLDMLMQKLEVASDKSLAAKLRVSNGIIGSLRAGTLPVSATLLTWMSEISGVTIDELRAVLGDRRARFRVAVRRQTSKPREVSTVIGEKNFQEQS